MILAATSAACGHATPAVASPGEHVDGQVIVRWAPGVDARERSRSRAAVSGRLMRRLGFADAEVVEVPGGISVEAAARRFERLPDVAWAEPNLIYRAMDLPADPFFAHQWALRNTGQTVGGVAGLLGADIGIASLWERTLGDPEVTVAVVDSGVAADHPDLRDRVVDGHDFVEDDALAQDWNGHGTMVAGVIAAEMGETGIAGVAPGVRLMPLRVLDAEGFGTLEDIAAAFDHAGELGVPIVNASLGGPHSQLMAEVIGRHPETLYVAAAGNAGNPVDLASGFVNSSYPCRFTHENVLCVAASDARDERPGWASWGRLSVDVAAPGHHIVAPALSDAVLFEDDFETPVEGRWTTGGEAPGWERTAAWAATGGFSLGYAPAASERTPGTRRAEVAMTFSEDMWKGRHGCHVDFDVRFQAGGGELRAVTRSGPHSEEWFPLVTFGRDTAKRVSVPLEAGATYLRFTELRFSVHTPEDLDPSRAHGAWIDDVGVRCRGWGSMPDTWELASGSSLAAPHVSGVAALMRSLSPGMSPEEMRARIVCGAHPAAPWSGLTVSGGRLHAQGALDVELRAPIPRSSGRIARLFDAWTTTEPRGMVPLPDGGLVFADAGSGQVFRWEPGQDPVPIAGDSDAAPETGDGGPALDAHLYRPHDVAVRPDGSILVVTQRVRVIGSDGIIRHFAGDMTGDYGGDGGPAASAGLGHPAAVDVAPDGSVYITGYVGFRGSIVRRVAPDGTISTVAGGGTSRDGGPEPARDAYLAGVTDLAVAPDGSLYLAEAEAFRLRRVGPAGTITTVAGNGLAGFSGDYGPATEASLMGPLAVAVSGDDVYLTDGINARVRAIDGNGIIRTVAGSAATGFPSPGQLALEASIGRTGYGVAVLADGRMAFSLLDASPILVVDDRSPTPVRPLAPRCPADPEVPDPPDPPAPPDAEAPPAATPTPDAAAPVPAGSEIVPPRPRALRRLVAIRIGRHGRRSVLRHGLVVRGRCSQPCRLRAQLSLPAGGRARPVSAVTDRARERWSLRLRLTARGRRLVERTSSRRLVLRLRARFGNGAVETRRWSLRM